MIGDGDCGEIGGMKIGRVKAKYSDKTYPSATLSTTNSTWLDPGLNPGRRGGKAASNRLSYGVVIHDLLFEHVAESEPVPPQFYHFVATIGIVYVKPLT
jgi:hypothetical protein